MEKKKLCQKCNLIFNDNQSFCPECKDKLVLPEITDDFLKDFLKIDDLTLARFKKIREQTIEEAKKLSKKNKTMKAIGISGSARDEFDMAGESSNSEFLLKECLEELKSLGAKTELIALRKYNIKPCKACYSTTNCQCHFYCSCYPKGTVTADDMSNVLYDKILEADIIIFATPVNDIKMSSHLSLFIDRCISLDGSLGPADLKATKNKELNIKHTQFVQLMADENVLGSGFFRRFAGKTAGIIVTGHEVGAAMVISSLFMALNHWGMAFAPWSNMYAMSSILNATHQDKKIVTAPVYIKEAKDLAKNAHALCALTRKNNWQYENSAN